MEEQLMGFGSALLKAGLDRAAPPAIQANTLLGSSMVQLEDVGFGLLALLLLYTGLSVLSTDMHTGLDAHPTMLVTVFALGGSVARYVRRQASIEIGRRFGTGL